VTAFDLMCSIFQTLNGQELDKISFHQSCDVRDRFMIWAGNIGALQHKGLPTSLDYRLRDAPYISKNVASLLISLKSALDGSKASHGLKL
jgi:hypothetical protein